MTETNKVTPTQLAGFQRIPAAELLRLQGLGESEGLPEDQRWTTREEWAAQKRTMYYDMVPEPSQRIGDYLSDEEQAAWVQAAREQWRELGQSMKATDDEDHRYFCKRRRSEIRKAIKEIEQDAGISSIRSCLRVAELHKRNPDPEAMTLLNERYRKHVDQITEAKQREVEQTPIDDEAWDQEIAWRYAYEQRWGKRETWR